MNEEMSTIQNQEPDQELLKEVPPDTTEASSSKNSPEDFYKYLDGLEIELYPEKLTDSKTTEDLTRRFLSSVHTEVELRQNDYYNRQDKKWYGFQDSMVRHLLLTHRDLLVPSSAKLGEEGPRDWILKAVIDSISERENVMECEQMVDVLLNDVHLHNKEALFREVVRLFWIPDGKFRGHDRTGLAITRERFVRWMAYGAKFGKEGFISYLQDQTVKNTSDKSPVEIAKILEICELLVFVGGDSYGSDIAEPITDLLDLLSEDSSSYLVSIRADLLSQYINKEKKIEFSPLSTAEDPDFHKQEEERKSRFPYSNKAEINSEGQGGVETKIESLELHIEQEIGPNYHLRELAPGVVGVFNPRDQLEYWVGDGAIELNEIDTLPLFKVGDNSTNSSLQQLQDASFLFSSAFRSHVEQDFGVDLSELDLRIQNQFLNYLKKLSVHEAEKVSKFTKTYGKNFLISFLSLERDAGNAQNIIEICENLDPSTVGIILEKYADLINSTNGIRDYLQVNLKEGVNYNPEVEEKVIEKILRSGEDILKKNSGLDTESRIRIHDGLENSRIGVEVFKAVIQSFRATGEQIRSADLGSVQFEKISGADLDEKAKRQMLLISDDNWLGRGEKEGLVAEKFRALLTDVDRLKQCEFHITSHENDVLGFFLLQKNDQDDSYYLGSVNARKDLAGTDVGSLILNTVITEAISGKNVWGQFSPKAHVAPTYINDLGFQGVRLEDDITNGDTLIVRRDGREEVFQSHFQDMSYKKMVDLSVEPKEDAVYFTSKYVFPDEYLAFTADADNLLRNHDAIITALKPEKYRKNGSYNVVIGFEKRVHASNNKGEPILEVTAATKPQKEFGASVQLAGPQ